MSKSAPLLMAVVIGGAVLAAFSPRREATPAAPAAATAAAAPATGIAWIKAASDADVDAAFAQARTASKPVLLYWGAKWCPPCNQLQATLFNRHDFIERTRAVVPVYIDGDSPGAQKLGARFKVRGYPTAVVFNPAGNELTRLPGEVDAAQLTEVLTLSMNAQRPLVAVLADARAGVGPRAAALTPNDWRLLAFYSWETDEQQLVPKAGLAALLKQLAAACPPELAEPAMRLLLKQLAATPKEERGRADAASRARVLRLLGDAAQARAHMDVLGNSAVELTAALGAAGSAERRELLAAFETALKRFEVDTSLSRADRLTALYARVELARIDMPKDSTEPLPGALLNQVRDHIAHADREISDGYERQAVIPFAGHVLQKAGLLDESDALLQANLARSHSPYYLMSELASNARKRGDKVAALRWYEQAFDTSEGPATRLQWGASYVNALVELAPTDEARIEAAALKLLGEAAAQPNVFYERSARSLQRIGSRLQAWNKDRAHEAAMQRLQTKLDSVCAALPAGDAQRGVCDALFKPAPATKADT
jgi:thioredoxin-like negative regulator of GroEL